MSLEGFVYVIAAFAAYLHGAAVRRPRHNEFANRITAYRHGLAITARLYVVVLITLLVAAEYEAFEIIYLLRFFF